MLKKFFIAVLACMTFTLIAAEKNCSAALALVRLTIGGITLGAEVDWVKSIYGEPTKIYDTTVNGERDACHEYGEVPSTANSKVRHLRLIYSRGRVMQIVCDGANDLRTFDGVKIGDDESVLKTVYGEPDKVGKPPTKLRRNVRADKFILYNSASSFYNLMFLTKHGKVVAIFSGMFEVLE